MPKAPVIAVLCSDIHLSHKPPLARSAEPNWYEAMANPMDGLYRLAHKYEVPLVIAGDIFDRWNSPAELINFAIAALPKVVWAIPGQHDLPFHNFDDMGRSAFGTLLASHKVSLIPDRGKVFAGYELTGVKRLRAWGFPWGSEITPCPETERGKFINIAVIHAYVWTNNKGYVGAPVEKLVDGYEKQLEGYDVALFGDNHKGFTHQLDNGCLIVNPGTFMRRKADEWDYRPTVYLLRADGSVEPRDFGKFPEVWLDAGREGALLAEKASDLDMSGFVSELNKLTKGKLDFVSQVKQWMDVSEVHPRVRKIILQAMEG